MLEFIITEEIKELSKLNLPDPDTLLYLSQLNDRRVFINYDIDESIILYNHYIMEWNKEDEGIPIEKRKPIKIFINTDGGCLNSILSFLDLIRLSKTPIHTIAMGKAYSAGFLLLIGGHKRFCFDNTSSLLHSGSFGIMNSSEKVYDYIEHNKKIEDKVKKYVVKNTNITEDVYDTNFRKEWYMDSEEMLSLGVVDEVIADLNQIM